MIRELVCIRCPLGCALRVEIGDGISVSGNSCPRGEEYGKKEVTDPRRVVTSSARVIGGAQPTVSLKTAGEVPKDRVKACAEQMRSACVKAPVRIGDVILEDCAGTGVAAVATRTVDIAAGGEG